MAISQFGTEEVFQTQYNDFLTVNGKEAKDAPAGVQDSAVLAIRDVWSLCAFDSPQFADDLAADSRIVEESVKRPARS